MKTTVVFSLGDDDASYGAFEASQEDSEFPNYRQTVSKSDT
jgi:hypothetical protein